MRPWPGVWMQSPSRARVREQQAGLRLAAVCGLDPATWPTIEAEVRRRREVFDAAWTASGRSGRGVSPLGAALESVYEDVTRGWL